MPAPYEHPQQKSGTCIIKQSRFIALRQIDLLEITKTWGEIVASPTQDKLMPR